MAFVMAPPTLLSNCPLIAIAISSTRLAMAAAPLPGFFYFFVLPVDFLGYGRHPAAQVRHRQAKEKVNRRMRILSHPQYIEPQFFGG